MNKSLSLSIVMPALNEEANIFVAINDTLQAFDSYNINGELIVVNDGSKDKTPEIIEEFCKKFFESCICKKYIFPNSYVAFQMDQKNT